MTSFPKTSYENASASFEQGDFSRKRTNLTKFCHSRVFTPENITRYVITWKDAKLILVYYSNLLEMQIFSLPSFVFPPLFCLLQSNQILNGTRINLSVRKPRSCVARSYAAIASESKLHLSLYLLVKSQKRQLIWCSSSSFSRVVSRLD